MDEPLWIPRAAVEALHHDQIRQHGGRFGLRDENLLESALARPRQRWAYEPNADLFDLAASYAFEVAKNHPFIDGNKRAAFMTLYAFLRANGWRLDVPEPEAVLTVLALAAGEIGEAELAAWCRTRSVAVGPPTDLP